jgi:hypothetical protein
MSNRLPAVTVVGSINLDLIATAERLPTCPGSRAEKAPTRRRLPRGWAAVSG